MFSIQWDGSALELRLESVTPQGHLGPERQSFSLLFLAPAEAPNLQQTYVLTHPELGELAMFLVPIARREVHLIYEAVFT